MNSPRSFDRLTRVYRLLELVAFGHDLERARFAHLDRLRACRSILVLGEGDGRCLARLVKIAPHAHIDCLDLSPAMLRHAAARLAAPDAARVTFRQADLLAAALPPGNYDAVVTLFFLDCFTAAQATAVMARIATSLQPGAWWLWADFTLPQGGLARWRAQAWLAVLFAFFRWQTALDARELPPVARLFEELGWHPVAETVLQHGLVRSAVFQHPAR